MTSQERGEEPNFQISPNFQIISVATLLAYPALSEMLAFPVKIDYKLLPNPPPVIVSPFGNLVPQSRGGNLVLAL